MILLLTSAYFSSCAIQGAGPQGGPKDEEPPKVKSESPANGTLNFTADKIIIAFDEYISLNDIGKEVIITPTLPQAPAIDAGRRSVVVDLSKNTLRPNTTYSIQFGKSIRDVNEGNVLENYNYLFSTGPYIDSLEMKGGLVNGLTGKAAAGYKVMLYEEADDDTSFLNGKPLYYTVSNATGGFTLSNLPEGTFRLRALEDKNGNYIADPDENIAFSSSLIEVTADSVAPLVLKVFPYINKPLMLENAATAGHKLYIKLNRAADDLKVKPASGLSEMNRWVSGKGDSLVIWYSDSIRAGQIFNISLDNKELKLDTAWEAPKVDALPSSGFSYTVTEETGNVNAFGALAVVTASDPIAKVDLKKMRLYLKDSVPHYFTSYKFLDTTHTRIALQYEYLEDSAYILAIYAGALTSVYGAYNADTSTSLAQLPERRKYGSIEIKLNVPDSAAYIFQMVDEQDNVFTEYKLRKKEEKLVLPYVTPGTYRFRYIKDTNNNGRWDGGSLANNTLPEQVFYSEAPVLIKANWEINDLKFSLNP